jgi:hypothetical protein
MGSLLGCPFSRRASDFLGLFCQKAWNMMMIQMDAKLAINVYVILRAMILSSFFGDEFCKVVIARRIVNHVR